MPCCKEITRLPIENGLREPRSVEFRRGGQRQLAKPCAKTEKQKDAADARIHVLISAAGALNERPRWGRWTLGAKRSSIQKPVRPQFMGGPAGVALKRS